jgi:thiol-disulfide isomerase/thioredoxin
LLKQSKNHACITFALSAKVFSGNADGGQADQSINTMLLRIFNWIKPFLGAFILIALLQVTGLMSSVSFYAQTALLKTGIRNAGTDVTRNPEPFDFNFTVRNTAGERINFDQYKGKVVFLNLWATWCGPCRAEMPTIQTLYEKMDTTGVAFVILSIDRDADEPKIAKFINQYKYTFPVYRPSGMLTSQLDIPSIPTTFIINKEGKIVAKEVGATNFDTAKFRKFLSSLL